MTYKEVKRLNPSLTELIFRDFVLLMQGEIIVYAFFKEYINKPNFTGAQHLCSSWVQDIQNKLNLKTL